MNTPAAAPLMYRVTPSSHALSSEHRAAILAGELGFGKYFTDHMVTIEWDGVRGWHDAQVHAYGPLALDPAAAVLHYGQEIFEGIKAYRHADGSIWTFRPEANGTRLQRSATRLALPQLPVSEFIESLRQLVAVDHDWVPSEPGTSLYFRPFMIATEAFLGVRAAQAVGYHVIASPAGAYFANGVSPVSIWLSRDYARAAKGGTGAAKCGGNYAASLLPQLEARAQGCSQVLFLDPVEGKYLEELGGMNVFLVFADGRIVTPELSGSILDGITRSSILQLARERGMQVEERKVSFNEWKDGVASGAIAEVFACGTAAVITPIGELKGEGFSIGDINAPAGTITMAIREQLTGIQYGRTPDRHGWLVKLR
jgi:branched-chain amino acid aminotransferase